MFKRVSQLFAVGAVFGLAACGSSDGGPSYATTVDSATTVDFANDAVQYANDVLVSMVDGQPATDLPLVKASGSESYAGRLLGSLRARAYARSHRVAPSGTPLAAGGALSAPFSTCEPNVTGVDSLGDPVDTDADGVPDDYLISFPAGCADSDSAGAYVVTYQGSVRFRDVDAAFGFRLDVTNLKVRGTETATGNYEQFSENGSESALFAGTGIGHDADVTYGVEFRDAGAPAPQPAPGLSAPMTTSYTFVYKESASFEPDSGDAYVVGGPFPSGDLDLVFEYRLLSAETGSPDSNFRFTMQTPTKLHYNGSCEDIDGGTLLGYLNGDADIGFQVDWSDCSVYEISVFGTTPAAVAAR